MKKKNVLKALIATPLLFSGMNVYAANNKSEKTYKDTKVYIENAVASMTNTYKDTKSYVNGSGVSVKVDQSYKDQKSYLQSLLTQSTSYKDNKSYLKKIKAKAKKAFKDEQKLLKKLKKEGRKK